MIMVGIVVNACTIWSPSAPILASARPRNPSPGRGGRAGLWTLGRYSSEESKNMRYDDGVSQAFHETRCRFFFGGRSVALSRSRMSVLGVGGLCKAWVM